MTDQLTATFSALADPTRRAILSQLASGEQSVTDLAKPYNMTMPAISKHLKVLEKAGLVRRSRTRQFRPCQLNAAPIKDAVDWMSQYREYWEQSFDRLEGLLHDIQAAEGEK